MTEFLRERELPECCQRSYREENGSRHETTGGEEYTCLECGRDWSVERDVFFDEDAS